MLFQFENDKGTSLPNGFSVSSMWEASRLSIFSGLLTSGPAQHIFWPFSLTVEQLQGPESWHTLSPLLSGSRRREGHIGLVHARY